LLELELAPRRREERDTMSKRPLHKSAGDLMSTALLCLRETDRISAASREMANAAIRHLPVIDEKGRLTGIVSNTDLIAAFRRGDPEVGTIMTREVRTVRAETPAERAVEIMLEEKINSIPVVGSDHLLVGILTATDFLVVAYQALTGAPIERAKDEL
jgi:CBS domain-containing protein